MVFDTPSQEELQTQIKAWNDKHSIGSKFRSDLYPDEEFVTRTEAVILFKHRKAVYFKDRNGYFDLDEIHPVGD